MEWGNEIQIQQLGITVTPTGKPFLLVDNQYDQGQHDDSRDTLAVSTAGMLVAGGLWQKLGGLNDTAPPFAQDIELCAQARVAGFRVVVEPRARVLHAGLSMQQARTRKWLGGSRTQALSRAHVHLAGILAPAPAPAACLFSSSARSFDFDPSKPDYKKAVANLWAVRRLAVGMVHRWLKAQGSQEASGPGKDSAAERFSGDKSSAKKAPRSQI